MTTDDGQESPATDTKEPEAPKRLHRATFSSDKQNGGYLIRIEGPNANKFANRKVPVTRKGGGESEETTANLIWSGKDRDNGKPCALYGMVKREKAKEDVPF